MTNRWVARVARVEVTPRLGAPMDGYADRTLLASCVLDPLEVNVAVLSDGAGGRFAWLSLDGIAVTSVLRRALSDAVARSTGMAAEQVVVAASHTHAGPAGWAGEIHPVLPARVDTDEVGRLSDVVGEAVGSAPDRHVELRYAEGTVTGGGANRHEVGGPHDVSCGVVSLMDGDEPVAVVFDYACHPTVLGPDNTCWSSDWVGPAREEVRRVAGPVPVVFLQGAAGDVSPRFVRQGRDWREAVRLGSLIGSVPAGLVGSGDRLPAMLRFVRWDVQLQTRQHAPSVADSDFAGSDRLAMSRREGAQSQRALQVHGMGASVSVPVSLLEAGYRRWLHVGAELFTSFAQELKRLDDRLRVVGYCDGYGGYLADAPAHERGEYEGLASFVDAGETRRFVDYCLAQVGSW